LDRTPGDRPVLVLSPEGVQVLRGEANVDLVQPATRARKPAPTESGFKGVDRPLFDALRNLRRELAAERAVPAYVIASDAVLRELARTRPSTVEAMGSIRGIGRKKILELGPRLLAFLDEWCPANGLARDMVD
ncbi:MAG: HRDC domain-containing protein, partial [Phycisphaerales bacterium]|nr:HRDC domain-containing protein [Phycisphaerales bacterium]